MPNYSTPADFNAARETEQRIAGLLGCEVLVLPRYAPFDCLFRFAPDLVFCVEIKRRKGNMGEYPLNKTVWLSEHKRLAALRLGLPLWFIVAADNGDFVWPDKGEEVRVDFTGRHGRSPERVMQIPVESFKCISQT